MKGKSMLEAIFTENVLTITLAGLYQWDYGQKLYIKGLELGEVEEIHFSNNKEKEALVRPLTKEGEYYTCLVPDVLLQKSFDIICWVYDIGENSGETIRTVVLKVEPRAKPQNFIEHLPDAEIILEDVLNKIDKNIKDNAEFKQNITEQQNTFEEKLNKAEEVRQNKEQTRVEAESGRVSAEAERVKNENARNSAESARATAEQGRDTAEAERVKNENARKTAESGRVSAENTRVSNESARKQAETDRANTWNSLKNDIEQTLQSGVINDGTPSGTKTWSSTKINSELGKKASQSKVDNLEKKIQSTVKAITLLASGWQGNQYTINDSLVTTTSNQMVMRGLTMTDEQKEAYFAAQLSEVGQSNGQMVIKADGEVPTIDIPIRVMFSMTLLETPRATDTVTLATRNDTGDSIKFGIDKDGNYGYIKAGADSVVPFSKKPDLLWRVNAREGSSTTGDIRCNLSKPLSNYELLIVVYAPSLIQFAQVNTTQCVVIDLKNYYYEYCATGWRAFGGGSRGMEKGSDDYTWIVKAWSGGATDNEKKNRSVPLAIFGTTYKDFYLDRGIDDLLR